MLTRATSHWPTTKGAAGNGLSLSRSIASNSERRLPSRGGANGRLFHSSIFSASAALAGGPAIGGDHHAVDEAGTAEPVEADAQIRLLHDQQRGVAAADGQEIGAAEEHGVVAE